MSRQQGEHVSLVTFGSDQDCGRPIKPRGTATGVDWAEIAGDRQVGICAAQYSRHAAARRPKPYNPSVRFTSQWFTRCLSRVRDTVSESRSVEARVSERHPSAVTTTVSLWR